VPTDENPVGSYRREFDVPHEWDGDEIFVEFGAVSSAFYVWINGEYVGYSEGSKTPSEFNVTEFVRPGANTIAVEVYRWSTYSVTSACTHDRKYVYATFSPMPGSRTTTRTAGSRSTLNW
jgi:beta-galactosidase/beta-glucuronidase